MDRHISNDQKSKNESMARINYMSSMAPFLQRLMKWQLLAKYQMVFTHENMLRAWEVVAGALFLYRPIQQARRCILVKQVVVL